MGEARQLPPDPDGMNDQRADWAQATLTFFSQLTGCEAQEEAPGDLLTNFHHWGDRQNPPVDISAVFASAHANYREETMADPDTTPSNDGASPYWVANYTRYTTVEEANGETAVGVRWGEVRLTGHDGLVAAALHAEILAQTIETCDDPTTYPVDLQLDSIARIPTPDFPSPIQLLGNLRDQLKEQIPDIGEGTLPIDECFGQIVELLGDGE